MTYQKALEYLEETTKYGSQLGLASIEELMLRLGNPQDKLEFVHISGTNGKGSVLAMISTVLSKQGYRVGRYISPTIFEYRERIQINGKSIPKQVFASWTERIREVCEEMVTQGLPHPTQFEIDTAMGFCYFEQKGCDIVVLETGLGGSMDATNLIKTVKTAVITSISRDHMVFLGDTLPEIAAHKAGIIKSGAHVVMLKQDEAVEEVICEVAREKRAPVYYADVKHATAVKHSLKKQSFTYGNYKKIELTLLGTYQIANAIIALEVLEDLMRQGMYIKDEVILQGIRDTVWPGRFMQIGKEPLFFLDGAHNEAGGRMLADCIQTYLANKKIIGIMGVFRDKEYEKIIELVVPFTTQVLTVAPPGQARALPAYELAQAVKPYQENVTVTDSLQEAIEIASLLAGKDGVVLAFGSLSFLGNMIELLQKKDMLHYGV